MGQKTNPIGLRIAVTHDWRSKWYAEKKEFGKLLTEDRKIRDVLKRKLESASVPKILIERAATRCRITILTARPGVVIGRKGVRSGGSSGLASQPVSCISAARSTGWSRSWRRTGTFRQPLPGCLPSASSGFLSVRWCSRLLIRCLRFGSMRTRQVAGQRNHPVRNFPNRK